MARLASKVAVLTGGAGGIGRVIAKRYLEEGATVVLTGRTLEKLKAAAEELENSDSTFKGRVGFAAMDGSSPESLAKGATEIFQKYGKVDILINNAGSAGPRQELSNIPLTEDDLKRLRASGSQDTETLREAVGSLLGSPWYTTQALLPHFNKGASVINVSTIFSRTEYYGRIPYVVPKAALNVLTRFMASELGKDARGIRVNTVYPGPVESDRIHMVFAAMDRLKGMPEGSTRDHFVGQMLLRNSPTGSPYLSKEEVANSIVFLGSDESTSYSGHDFEVTHGMRVPEDNYTHVIARPNLRVVDLEERLIWIIAGDQVTDACALAQKHHEMGADIFLTFRDPKALEEARTRIAETPGYTLELLDPLNAEDWHKVETTLYLKHQLPRATIILQAYGPGHYGAEVMSAKPEVVQKFFDTEIHGAIAVAQRLDQLFNAADKRLTADPVVVFMGNPSDGKGNSYASIRRAAIQQLIRVWRHENELMNKSGRRQHRLRINQLVRFENDEALNLDLACEWAISLSNGLRQISAIDLTLAPKLAGSLQSRVALNWERQALRGLHLRKVALITGGSEGIGGEAARLLALAGARVALAARSREKLEKHRQTILEELQMAGYAEPEKRVLIIPDCDVADPKALETMVEQTLARFGRIDYLLNNAGISGLEQMVVDMPIEGWDHTLMANLISNYDLILRVLPHMKKQKSGHIINVSSHFGGVRHATTPYPNRSDYAVSKAGQRALAEVLASFLGPDVQINAVAPGPVDGVRLRGTAQRPGLYARRAKLILENKRMNLVYSALVTAYRCGDDMSKALDFIGRNSVKNVSESKEAPEALRVLTKTIAETAKEQSGSATHLLTRALVERMLDRLTRGGFLPPGYSRERLLATFVDAPEPFFPQSQIDLDAAKIKSSVLSTLALKRMPSETDVGREVVFYLANKNVTGETLHPSCGLTLERLTMSGDFVGRAHPDLLRELRGQTIVIAGNWMFNEMAQLANSYASYGAKKVVVLTRSEAGRDTVLKSLGGPNECIDVLSDETHPLDEALDLVIAKYGVPDVIVSMPLGGLPAPSKDRLASPTLGLPSIEEFRALVENHLTNHLILARRGSLIDRCRIVFVTPMLSEKFDSQTAALVNFIQTTLRPLTVTGGQEGGRLIHKAIFNQVDVAASGLGSRMTRLIEAVLLVSLPPAPASDSADKVRSSPGTTITV